MRKSAQLLGLAIVLALVVPAVHAGNKVLGELEFKGKTKVERTSGVWIDGNYVGYLKELKGSKQVLLLPGEHVITVRQNGYLDFVERVQLQPGQKQVVHVLMEKAPTSAFPAVASTVKLAVNPSRAAVFLDGQFVGHVGEFEGLGRGLLVAPGAHRIKVSLPGFQSFETEINPLPRQKVEVRTNLLREPKPRPGAIQGSSAREAPIPPPEAAIPPPEPAEPSPPPPNR